jgi:hypothetical protein
VDGRRIIWILGSSRSGSTWLLSMLSKLDGVVPMDDPHLGHHLGVWRPIPLAWADDEANPELRTLDEIKRRQPDYFFSDRYRDVWARSLRGSAGGGAFIPRVRRHPRGQGAWVAGGRASAVVVP